MEGVAAGGRIFLRRTATPFFVSLYILLAFLPVRVFTAVLHRRLPRGFFESLREVGLGREAQYVGNLSDGTGGGLQQGFCLLDSFLQKVVDGGQPRVFGKGVGQVIFVHMGEGGQGIQRDILRVVCVQIIFDLGAFPVQEFLIPGHDGQMVIAQHADQQDLQQVLAHGFIIVLLGGDFFQHDIQIGIYIGALHVVFVDRPGSGLHGEAVLGGGDILEGEGKTFDSQGDIVQRFGVQGFFGVLHMGVDNDHVVFGYREFGTLRDKSPVAVHHIEQFAERVRVQNALPVSFIFGCCDVQELGTVREGRFVVLHAMSCISHSLVLRGGVCVRPSIADFIYFVYCHRSDQKT